MSDNRPDRQEPPRHICITIDVDWAPDFVVRYVADLLSSRGIPSTWFVTHPSAAINELQQSKELYELGIHPNFQRNSTQGQDIAEVISYCLDIVPDAFSMRTHGLLQSTEIFRHILNQTSLKADVSLYLPHARHAEPVEYCDGDKCLIRIPYVFEDDFEILRSNPLLNCHEIIKRSGSLVVFDFHPIHIYLNSKSLDAYEQVKRRFPNVMESTEKGIRDYVNSEYGVRDCFLQLLDILSGIHRPLFIREVVDHYFNAPFTGSLSGKAA